MIVKEILGRERSFEFTMKTFVFIHKLTGVSDMPQVFENLANKKAKAGVEGEFTDEPVMGQIEHMEYISRFLFATAKTASELNGEPIDYNEAIVYTWVDYLGWQESLNLVQDLTEIYVSKNLVAPKQGPKSETV